MRKIFFFLIYFALLGCTHLSGCAFKSSNLPPKNGFYSSAPIYIDYNVYDPAKVPAPPVEGSKEDLEDLRILQDWQNKRTKVDCELAEKEEIPDLKNMFASEDILPNPIPESVDHFFWAVRSDTGRLNSRIKKYYKRERPFVRFPNRFIPCIKREESLSYPSGHAAIARVYALILAKIYPDKAKQLDQRANISSERRVLGGVHHPSDIKQGQEIGGQIFELLKGSPQFMHDLSAIKECLALANCP